MTKAKLDWGLLGEQPPRLPFIDLFVDTAGLSSLAMRELDGFQPSQIGHGSAVWSRVLAGQVEQVRLNLLPVGWEGDWHESPAPQWVVALSGRWWVEMQDGQRLEMGVGDIHWGGDIGTRATSAGVGHRSGVSGEEPCLLLAIRYAREAAATPE